MDDCLGGGIYWCEQKKESKNTCSNAPGSVFALKLFKATQDSSYFEKGKSLYEWTKATLQDTTDCLYFDNMRLDGEIGRAKFAYNSGQMMQSAALLYQLTGNGQYLKDAQAIAAACHNLWNSIRWTVTRFILIPLPAVWTMLGRMPVKITAFSILISPARAATIVNGC